MPVLDASALERDPKGMAFLLSVIGQRSCGCVRTTPAPDLRAAALNKRDTVILPVLGPVCLTP